MSFAGGDSGKVGFFPVRRQWESNSRFIDSDADEISPAAETHFDHQFVLFSRFERKSLKSHKFPTGFAVLFYEVVPDIDTAIVDHSFDMFAVNSRCIR